MKPQKPAYPVTRKCVKGRKSTAAQKAKEKSKLSHEHIMSEWHVRNKVIRRWQGRGRDSSDPEACCPKTSGRPATGGRRLADSAKEKTK